MRFSIIIATVFIAITIALVPHTSAAAEVYRWVDENGVVHFGDLAPDQGNAEKISVQPSPGAQSSPLSDPASDSASPYTEQATDPQPSYAQQLRDSRAAQKQERAEKAEVSSEICQLAREVVSRLEPSTRVNMVHKDGTVTRMDDNVRLEKLAEAKALVAENCDKSP
ncbi:MAG: DUF4124 domain-containing protein [Xanthomonadales bacterium]|nr:DUF4124 domain-containing protein [Xanthomonadales bacterium]